MLNCVAIDDEPLALVILEEFCGRSKDVQLQKTFSDVSEAAKYLRKFPVDLVFLDIQMPDQNGIDFYRQHAHDKMVIFTTAFSEYAVEGFNLSAIDYLLKPIEFNRFQQAVARANEYHAYLHTSGAEQMRHLFVRSEYSLVKIAFADIDYIETLDDYIKIHVAGKKPVLTKMNLKNVMGKLSAGEFVRIHRSYIVPLKKVQSVRNKYVQLSNTELPIGVKFEEGFLRLYTGR